MYMENQKKPLIYYWLIALAVMFVINWLVLPMFANNTVQEVSYNVFGRIGSKEYRSGTGQ